jgi:uncharacterized protein (TIGR02145 family)
MKKTFSSPQFFFLLLALSSIIAGFNSCNSSSKMTDPGVVINGVKWATRNLDTGGKFAATPESYGALFQWGRKDDGHESRSSATTETLSSTDNPGHGNFILALNSPRDWRNPQNDALWNAGTESAPVKSANDPCPAGWRVPTDAEIATLFDSDKVSNEWTTQNGISGRKFTDNSTGSSLFLPAAGYRYSFKAAVLSAGEYGYYWSSRLDGIYACNLLFYSDYADWNSFNRSYGQSLRPVAE